MFWTRLKIRYLTWKITWRCFRELWSVSRDKTVLIGQVLFNPKAIRQRYNEEQRFKRALDRHWKK